MSAESPLFPPLPDEHFPNLFELHEQGDPDIALKLAEAQKRVDDAIGLVALEYPENKHDEALRSLLLGVTTGLISMDRATELIRDGRYFEVNVEG